MAQVIFTVPTPPSTNSLYRNARGRGRVKTERYLTWIAAAVHSVKWPLDPIDGPVTLGFQVPDDKRRDLDNFLKGPIDLLVSQGVLKDDNLVQRIVIERAARPDCLITVGYPDNAREAA